MYFTLFWHSLKVKFITKWLFYMKSPFILQLVWHDLVAVVVLLQSLCQNFHTQLIKPNPCFFGSHRHKTVVSHARNGVNL